MRERSHISQPDSFLKCFARVVAVYFHHKKNKSEKTSWVQPNFSSHFLELIVPRWDYPANEKDDSQSINIFLLFHNQFTIGEKLITYLHISSKLTSVEKMLLTVPDTAAVE